ncbi:hypothetical protein PCG10_004541 [Penicillium crustosum]|uniref:Diaminohydroxyphosphoribosylamino-pyrimidine deaminase n=1 Tax=Penicillium crustosum TaxID=36656 RepID=A0A9P5GS65_PENCR|nr:uncharacterized protein N7487_008435 [Penicillium crustosum]KAF7525791.1 hypothetical protein PCG10_004541 [Penicillium crustosum]KAJ5402539.1 hypothetical protein N7487_008435 [Penicillium crustosum]
MDQIIHLLANGEEVIDVDEESFLLFAQDIQSNNLGMLNPRAPSVEITINDNEYTIHQSPSLLSSHRAGGTTGAEWITNPSNPLWTTSLLSQTSTVAELGTGISALVALVLAPSVRHYIATDQEYVRKLFRTNLDANASVGVSSSNSKAKGKSKGSKSSKSKSNSTAKPADNISFTTLDWETDQAASLKECMDSDDAHAQDEGEEEDKGFDLLLSCDCIYNEALVAPFVRTCAEICRLRPAYVAGSEEPLPHRKPTVCIIAQQQRSPDVFETWLRETMREFRVWRLSDDALGEGLKSGSGYLVHLLLARDK